jgi:hypothetical protein
MASICDVLFDSDDDKRISASISHDLKQHLWLDTDCEKESLTWHMVVTSKDPVNMSSTAETHSGTLRLLAMDASNAAAKAKREKDAAFHARIDAELKVGLEAIAEERRIYRRARRVYHEKLEAAYDSGNAEVIACRMDALDPTDPVVVRQEIAKFKALFARRGVQAHDAELDRLEAEVAESAKLKALSKIDDAGAAATTAQAKAAGDSLSRQGRRTRRRQ